MALIYQQTGQCPVNLPLSTEDQQVRMHIAVQAPGVTNTDCAIIATIQNVSFPVRYLNDQTLVFYHLPDSDDWACTSSLNKKQAPKSCLAD